MNGQQIDPGAVWLALVCLALFVALCVAYIRRGRRWRRKG